MSHVLLLGMPSGMEWVLLLGIILLLFGGSRLPQLAKALGQSKRAFREGQDEAEAEAERDRLKGSATSAPAELSAVDDEALFEEARRRAAARRESQKN